MSGHPLKDLADAVALMDVHGLGGKVDPAVNQGTVGKGALASDVLLSLHPDVARCALALASGLVVPEGWTVEMTTFGYIAVTSPIPERGGHTVASVDDVWRAGTGFGFNSHPTAQLTVDAAVKALGGAT